MFCDGQLDKCGLSFRDVLSVKDFDCRISE